MTQTSTGSLQALRASCVTSMQWLLVWCGMMGGAGLWLGLSVTQAAETVEISYAKGVLEYGKQNYVEALGHLQTAAELAPDNPDVQFYLGLTLTRVGEFDKAIAALTKTLQLDATKQYTHYHLGLAYFNARRYPEALPQFETAAQFDPQKAPTAFYLGQTLYNLKRYSTALPHFARAMELDPTLAPTAQYYRGLTLYAAERDAQAQEAFEAVVNSGADSPLIPQSRRYLEALAQRASSRRMVQLQGSLSFEYDDNVILEPNGVEISEQADGRMVLSAVARLLPILTPSWHLGMEYELYQSLHFNLHEFDIQSHTIGLVASLKLEPVTLYGSANYNYTFLEGARFSEAITLQPSAVIKESEALYTVASVRYRTSNYFDTLQTGEVPAVRDRDGWAVRAGLYQYVLFNHQRSSVRIGYHYEGSRNDGTDWEYNSHEVGIALETPLGWDVKLTIEGLYTLFDYLHINSFAANPLGLLTQADTLARKDDRFVGVIALTRPLGRFWTLAAGYVHTSNLSNVGFFDYRRNIWTLAISGRY